MFVNKDKGKPNTPEVTTRARRTAQTSLFEPRTVDHPVAEDLEKASAWLDGHPELLELIAADVAGEATTGQHGLTCETILRCAALKHLWQHSYRELEFLLRDSASAQRFARVEAHRAPGKTALQAAVAAVGRCGPTAAAPVGRALPVNAD